MISRPKLFLTLTVLIWITISTLILLPPFDFLDRFVIWFNPSLSFILILGCSVVLAAVSLVIFVKKILLSHASIKNLEPADWFVIGGIASLMTVPFFTGSNHTLDIHLHDTYFVIAHGHIMGAVAVFFGLCAAVYYFFSNAARQPMNKVAGWIHFWVTFIGMIVISIPVHYVGQTAAPRNYRDYSDWSSFHQFGGYNLFISGVAIAVFTSQLIFIFNIVYTIFTLLLRLVRGSLRSIT